MLGENESVVLFYGGNPGKIEYY